MERRGTFDALQRAQIRSASTAGSAGWVICVDGELDLESVPALRGQIERALRSSKTSMVVDLSDVTFIDSLALAALVAAAHKLAPDRRLAIVAQGNYFDLLMRATGLHEVLEVFDNRYDAEAFAFGPR